MHDPFFIEPATGSRLLYSELWQACARPEIQVPTVLQTTDAREITFALARAVLLGHPLALPPPGQALEPHPSSSALTVPGLRSATLADALAEARTARNGFRLTLYTSGSTGLPRSVTHRIDTLARAVRTSPRHASDVWGLAYDPAHIAGVQVILQALFNRNPLVHLGRLPPSDLHPCLREAGVTRLSATPSFYRLLLSPGVTFPAIRSASLGGEPADPALLARLAAMFPSARIRNLYGSTEAGPLLEAEGELFSIPEKLSAHIRILHGQLEIHPDLLGLFPSASDRPADTAWYRTGDTVEIVSEHPLRFRIVGRERDWVNVGGQKVNPAEVEARLLSCPGVREARVFARANSVTGQILCAEVVADPLFSEPAARVWLAERLPDFQIPRLIKTVPSLPRTRTGKLQRPPSPPPASPPPSPP